MLEISWSKHLVQRFGLIVQHRIHRFERDRLSLQRHIPTLPNIFPWSFPKKRANSPTTPWDWLTAPPPALFILEAPPAPWIFPNLVFSQGSRRRPALWDWSYLPGGGFNSQGRPEERVGPGHFHGAMFATYMNQEHKTAEFNVSPTDIPNHMKFCYQQIDLLVVPSRAGCCVSCTSFHRFNVEMVDRFSRRFLLYKWKMDYNGFVGWTRYPPVN